MTKFNLKEMMEYIEEREQAMLNGDENETNLEIMIKYIITNNGNSLNTEDFKTFKQWEKEGRKITKGSKAIKLHMPIIKKDEVTQEEKIGGYRLYALNKFHITQTEERAKTETKEKKQATPKKKEKKQEEPKKEQATSDEYSIEVKTAKDIRKVAELVAKKYWGLEFNDMEIKINGRLSRALGRCISKYNPFTGELKPFKLDFSGELFKKYKNELIVKVIKHEVCHWACITEGKPHKDGANHFESEIKRIGSVSTRSPELEKGRIGA